MPCAESTAVALWWVMNMEIWLLHAGRRDSSGQIDAQVLIVKNPGRRIEGGGQYSKPIPACARSGAAGQ